MALLCTTSSRVFAATDSFSSIAESVNTKMVKIYGAGGIRGLESYQSGFLVSDEGHIVTAWSYVLDTEYIIATLHDGRKFEAKMIGADPRLEIAVIKIEGTEFPYFDPKQAVDLEIGSRVLAFSNLYGVATGNEPTSVLHGSVSAVTNLSGRRGAYKTTYNGPIYVVDAMTNNAGAAGGVLTDRRGNLAAVLGKELRNDQNNVWLNYAIPVSKIEEAISDMIAGRVRSRKEKDSRKKPEQAATLDLLGIVLLPNLLNKTPPFVQYVAPKTPAEVAGLKADDLVLYVGETVVQSRSEVESEISYIDRLDPVRVTVQRGQELLEIEMLIE